MGGERTLGDTVVVTVKCRKNKVIIKTRISMNQGSQMSACFYYRNLIFGR